MSLLKKLQDSLHEGKVRFSFTKVDGSTREAYGTLHPSLLPPRVEGDKTSTRAPNPGVQVYFDLDAGSFRSFKKENLVAIKDSEVVISPVSGIPEKPANNPTEGLPV